MPLGFHSLIHAALLLLLLPLLIFYFLKLRRPHVQIPSLVLWQQVLRDRRVNSPFQRFKRHLLLLLQILVLILLALAAMQPFWRTQRVPPGQRLPIIVDCSASMGARAAGDGPSRLELAKRRVLREVEALAPGHEICLISFTDRARKRCSFTGNQRLLREALDAITCEDRPGDLEDALRMCGALRRSTPFDEVLLLSDGNFPAEPRYELPFRLRFERLPPAGANLGVTAFSATRSETDAWQVLVRVEATAGNSGGATLTIRDDETVRVEQKLLAADKGQRLSFEIRPHGPLTLEAKLRPESADALAADNTAYLTLPALRPLQVFIAKRLVSYRHAVGAHPDVTIGDDTTPAPSAAWDLVIGDSQEDMARPASISFFTGVVPAPIRALIADGPGGSNPVVDWQRLHPLLVHVQLGELVTTDAPAFRATVQDHDCEQLGYRVLVHGQRGPLLLERTGDDRSVYFLLPHSDRTTLPYRVGFPVLVGNLLRLTGQRAQLSEVDGRKTGVVSDIALPADQVYELQGPQGRVSSLHADATGRVSGLVLPHAGRYEVSRAGRLTARLDASLLSSLETRLTQVEEIRCGELAVKTAAAAPAPRALWRYVAAAALLVLLGEWCVFNRRPGGPPHRVAQ